MEKFPLASTVPPPDAGVRADIRESAAAAVMRCVAKGCGALPSQMTRPVTVAPTFIEIIRSVMSCPSTEIGNDANSTVVGLRSHRRYLDCVLAGRDRWEFQTCRPAVSWPRCA